MWETIKNALIGVKDAAGIEIPGLPADLVQWVIRPRPPRRQSPNQRAASSTARPMLPTGSKAALRA